MPSPISSRDDHRPDEHRPDEHWRRFRESGDPDALGALFDALSPELFRVALSLAPDAATAEDALQETWLVALKSAERHDATRPVVPWLVGILRRKVHEVRRAARTPDADRVARRAPVADPSLAAETAEDSVRLAAALDALPASCREVAVLRWRYGLEPAEIADARRIPPGTVRSLLHRALARLRRDLRAAPALFPLVRWPRGLGDLRRVVMRAARLRSATLTALGGGLLVAKTTKLTVAAVAALLLLGAGTAVHFAAKPAQHATGEAVGPTTHATAALHERVRGEHESAGSAVSLESATEKPFARGIVVDESGVPIVGCRVMVRGHETMGGDDVQDAPVRLDAAPAAITADDGRFVVPRKPDDLASLTFVADGFECVETRSFDSELRIVLAPCDGFAARVLDTAGVPLSDVDVRAMGAWVKSSPRWTTVWLRATTGADGRFEFRSLPREARLSSMSRWGYRVPGPPMGSLPIQELYVLERSCLIVDVSDAVTHEPIADARGLLVGADGALLGEVEPQPSAASSAALPGRLFRDVTSFRSDVTGELRVFAAGHRAKSQPLTIDCSREPPLVGVELAPGDDPPVLAGRVIDGAGARIDARFTPRVGGKSLVYNTDSSLPLASSTTTAADGAFAITGIPAGNYRVIVTREAEVPIAVDVTVPATSLEFRFPPKAALEVRYRDATGHPLEDSWIHVEAPPSLLSWSAKTDRTGTAVFDALPTSEVVVIPIHNTGVFLRYGGLASLANLQPLPAEVRTLSAGSRETIDLVRPDPCTVSVVVRDDAGNPVADAELHVKADGGFGYWLREERERLPLLELATDAAGRAHFDALPCRGEVKALRQGRVNLAKFTADAGSFPTVEILLPSVTGRITGRVLERGTGVPVSGRPVRVGWDHKIISQAVTGDDGRFVAAGVPRGPVSVSVAGYTDANDPMERRIDPKSPYGLVETEFTMAAGDDRDLSCTLPRIKGANAEPAATAIEASVVDDAGVPVGKAYVIVRGLVDGAWCGLADVQTDASGRARVEVVAAERYRISASVPTPVGSPYDTRSASVDRDPARALVEKLVVK